MANNLLSEIASGGTSGKNQTPINLDYLDPVKYANDLETLKANKMANRINYLKMGQAEFEQQQQQKLMDAYGGDNAYAQAMKDQSDAKSYLDWAKPVFEAAVKNGDNNTLKTLAESSKNMKNRYIDRMMGSFGDLEITGENEFKSTKTYTPETWEKFKQSLLKTDPNLENKLEGIDISKPVETHIKHGKLAEVKNPKEEKTSEDQDYRDGLKEIIKKEHPDWSPKQIAFEAARRDRKEKQEASIHKSKVIIDLRKGASEGGVSKLPNVSDMPAGQKNEAALEGLDAGKKNIVKQIAEYRIPLPSGFALRSPYWQNILQRVAMYDPSFDASQYNVRMKLRNDFNSGKSANNIRSLNTAVSHLGDLVKAGKGLENSPIQLWNTIANKGLTATGDSRVTKFNTIATAVESELAAVFKGMGATDQEIKAWRANINASQSPKQLKDNIDAAVNLMGGRLGALQNQHEVGMGKTKDFRFLSPKSKTILKKLGADVDKLDPVQGKVESSNSGNDNIQTIRYDSKGNRL